MIMRLMFFFFFFSSRRRHTRWPRDWSSDVCSSDLVSLLIGPRDANHSCDLTAVELILESAGEAGREWNLAKDVSPDVLAGNPHADRFGNEGVWHFYTDRKSVV